MTYWKTLTTAGKLIVAGVVLVLLVVAFLTVRSMLTAGPKAEARLGKTQAEAAAQSGSDAVNTVGKAGEREAAIAELDRTNEKGIRDAEGSDAAVNPAARDAGRNSLCKRAAYREHPKCVQRADPR